LLTDDTSSLCQRLRSRAGRHWATLAVGSLAGSIVPVSSEVVARFLRGDLPATVSLAASLGKDGPQTRRACAISKRDATEEEGCTTSCVRELLNIL